jgi:hypothetical protein
MSWVPPFGVPPQPGDGGGFSRCQKVADGVPLRLHRYPSTGGGWFAIYQKVFRASRSSAAKGIVATASQIDLRLWSISIQIKGTLKGPDLCAGDMSTSWRPIETRQR